MTKLYQQDDVAREAIKWMVLLRSGEATTADYENYRQWRLAQPAHENACQRIEKMLGQFEPLLRTLPPEPLRQALLTPSSRRKALKYGLGMFATVTLSALLLNRRYLLSPVFADMKTMTAQRRSVTLPDGSKLTLDARTAVNITVRTDASFREVALLSGGILLEIKDDARRPFRITTNTGSMLVLSGRMNVRYEDGGVHIGVLENVAKITQGSGRQLVLHAGQGAWFDENSLLQVAIRSEAEVAWICGRLEVQDRSLGSVVRTLSNYTSGMIRVDPAVAELRVSGNFPLDDINRALDSLAQTMPIAIVHTTDYWVHIKPASYRRNALAAQRT